MRLAKKDALSWLFHRWEGSLREGQKFAKVVHRVHHGWGDTGFPLMLGMWVDELGGHSAWRELQRVEDSHACTAARQVPQGRQCCLSCIRWCSRAVSLPGRGGCGDRACWRGQLGHGDSGWWGGGQTVRWAAKACHVKPQRKRPGRWRTVQGVGVGGGTRAAVSHSPLLGTVACPVLPPGGLLWLRESGGGCPGLSVLMVNSQRSGPAMASCPPHPTLVPFGHCVMLDPCMVPGVPWCLPTAGSGVRGG